MRDKNKTCDFYHFFIVKWLYRLSFEYPDINDNIYINGLTNRSYIIKLYGDLSKYDDLIEKVNSMILMFSDKPIRLKHVFNQKPNAFIIEDGNIVSLSECFDSFRQQLRNDAIDDLLN